MSQPTETRGKDTEPEDERDGRSYGGSPHFVIIGDFRMSNALHYSYYFGPTDDTFDPSWTWPMKYVGIGPSWYSVEMLAVNTEQQSEWSWFHCRSAQILILVYHMDSKESFQNLLKTYDHIPKPYEGKIQFELQKTTIGVPFEQYPIVVIGCTHSARVLEQTEEKDLREFVNIHPECIYGGCCQLDRNANTNAEAAIRVVVEVYDRIRKEATEKIGISLPDGQRLIKPPENVAVGGRGNNVISRVKKITKKCILS